MSHTKFHKILIIIHRFLINDIRLNYITLHSTMNSLFVKLQQTYTKISKINTLVSQNYMNNEMSTSYILNEKT